MQKQGGAEKGVTAGKAAAGAALLSSELWTTFCSPPNTVLIHFLGLC